MNTNIKNRYNKYCWKILYEKNACDIINKNEGHILIHREMPEGKDVSLKPC